MTDKSTPGPSRKAMAYRALAMVASLAFVSVLVMTSSRAAFVDTTDNSSNQFSAGTVALADDDAGSVLFDLTDLAPDRGPLELHPRRLHRQPRRRRPPVRRRQRCPGAVPRLTIQVGNGGSVRRLLRLHRREHPLHRHAVELRRGADQLRQRTGRVERCDQSDESHLPHHGHPPGRQQRAGPVGRRRLHLGSPEQLVPRPSSLVGRPIRSRERPTFLLDRSPGRHSGRASGACTPAAC